MAKPTLSDSEDVARATTSGWNKSLQRFIIKISLKRNASANIDIVRARLSNVARVRDKVARVMITPRRVRMGKQTKFVEAIRDA